MQDITVWHNPKCSKSRSALAYLETKEIIPTIVKYLDEDLTNEQIKDTLKL
jgi:arsenate reductase